jgi:hypothetical protein
MKKSECLFGSIDTKTGEIQKGYIDRKGKMQYKKTPWYKKLFLKKPREIVYLGADYFHNSNRPERRIPAVIYKEINPYTNEVYCVWAKINGIKTYFNVDLYKQNGWFLEE